MLVGLTDCSLDDADNVDRLPSTACFNDLSSGANSEPVSSATSNTTSL